MVIAGVIGLAGPVARAGLVDQEQGVLPQLIDCKGVSGCSRAAVVVIFG